MVFEKDDLRIVLERFNYRFYNRDCADSIVLSGIPVMEIYYAYDHGKDWGSVEGEYVTIEETKVLRNGLLDFMNGKSKRVEINFCQDFCGGGDFLEISVKRSEKGIWFRMLLQDMFELLEFEQVFSDEEWLPYYKEFLTWGEELTFDLGDEVKTLVRYDDDFYWKGRIGKVYKLLPPEPDDEDTHWMACVCFVENDLPKPWLNGRLYYLNEIEKLE